MTTTIDNPYHVLGVKDNAGMNEVTAAYKKLAKKYHPDLNPDDAVAAEAMKTINMAYEKIKNGYTVQSEFNASTASEAQTNAAPHYEQKSSNSSDGKSKSNVNEKTKEEYFMITKPHRLIVYMIYSLLLAGAALYGFYVLTRFFHTNEFILSYYSDGISIYAGLKDIALEVVQLDGVKDVLPLMFKSYDADVFIQATTIFVFVSMILFTATLIVTVIYNALYFACVKIMDKCAGAFQNPLTGADALRAYQLQNRMKRTIQISNIVYAALSYLSLLVTELSVIMITILSGVGLSCAIFQEAEKIKTVVVASRIFIALGFVILFFVAVSMLIKKKERIATQGKYACYENLNTYLLGIVIALIPVLSVMAIAVVVCIIVIKFLIWFIKGLAY